MGKAKYIIEGLNQGSLQPPPPLGGRALPLPLDFLSPLDEVKGGGGGIGPPLRGCQHLQDSGRPFGLQGVEFSRGGGWISWNEKPSSDIG